MGTSFDVIGYPDSHQEAGHRIWMMGSLATEIVMKNFILASQRRKTLTDDFIQRMYSSPYYDSENKIHPSSKTGTSMAQNRRSLNPCSPGSAPDDLELEDPWSVLVQPDPER